MLQVFHCFLPINANLQEHQHSDEARFDNLIQVPA